MKKNRILIAGVITAFVALITLSLVSGTWAKYTSQVQGSDTAKVAKWAFTYDGKDIESVEDADIKLFDATKIYELDTTGNVDTANLEQHVKKGTDEAIIAPGVGGLYQVEVVNNSEVDAKYEVSYELVAGSAAVPLEFSTDNSTWKKNLSDVATAATDLNQGETKTITVYWRWAFTDTTDTNRDVNDTTLGIAEGNVTIKVIITFTQVD